MDDATSLSAAIDAARPRGPFDLVTLLIGVNDQYRGRSAEEYRRAVSSRAESGDDSQAGRRLERDRHLDPGLGRDAASRRAGTGARSRPRSTRSTPSTATRRRLPEPTTSTSRGLSRLAANNRNLVAADGLHPSARDVRRVGPRDSAAGPGRARPGVGPPTEPFQAARSSACCSQLRIGGNHAPHCAVDSRLRVRELGELGRGVHAETAGDLCRRPIRRAIGGRQTPRVDGDDRRPAGRRLDRRQAGLHVARDSRRHRESDGAHDRQSEFLQIAHAGRRVR